MNKRISNFQNPEANEPETQKAKAQGFTLVEILIVLGIISILVTIVSAAVLDAKKSARIARTQADLTSIADAVEFLVNDTGMLPNYLSASQCIHTTPNNEVYLDSTEEGGLHGTGVGWGNWQGRYAERSLIDSWGNSYWFDHDYDCSTPAMGCGAHVGQVQAIVSSGPNGSGLNVYDTDNIILVRCAG